MSEREDRSLLDTERKQVGKRFNSGWKCVLNCFFSFRVTEGLMAWLVCLVRREIE